MSTDREEDPVRIAMWSGPRNISTAMMRSFENRPDTAVWDEPFYAAYLAATGLAHPMRDDVIAAGIPDPSEVVRRILGPAPDGAAVFYQKHMAHHMVDGFDRAWMERVVNCFLIRAPERVLASYAARRQQVSLADIGFVQQHALFEQVAQATGSAPAVLEAADVLDAPESMLRGLCAAGGIAFMPQMLHWPAGPRESDGVWGRHWYASVWKSTGFAGPDPAGAKRPALPDALRRIADQARPHYDALWRHRMRPAEAAAG